MKAAVTVEVKVVLPSGEERRLIDVVDVGGVRFDLGDTPVVLEAGQSIVATVRGPVVFKGFEMNLAEWSEEWLSGEGP
jgi:hypothetical protein